jgi:predicted AlkP superfamily pyrophosphatase or phosphodiesterase
VSNSAYTWDAYSGGELGKPTQQLTVSGPSWSSILTGVWVNKHRVWNNSFADPNFDEYPHFFKRIREKRPDAYLSSIVSWHNMNELIPGGADYEAIGNDEEVAEKVVEHLATANPDVLFVYFDNVDHAGHEWGFSPSVPEYNEAISKADGYVGAIMNAVKRRPTYGNENWLTIVLTDHGGIGMDHGGQQPEVRTVFIIVTGKSAKRGEMNPGPGIVAVPPTIMQHLGIDVEPQWGWEATAFGLNTSAITEPNDKK